MSGDVVEVPVEEVDELIARLVAVRGCLQDQIENTSVVYQGMPAVLDFVEKICHRLKGYILGAGSAPLQDLLVKDVSERLHSADLGKHFSVENFEAKITQMNGYQSHLISPELAMRALVADALKDVAPVASWLVLQVRSFVSQAASNSAKEIVEQDPFGREEIANRVVMGIELLLDEWEREAESVATVVMEMEQSTVSPVFFRRLALKRVEAGQLPAAEELSGRAGGIVSSLRNSGAGFMARMGLGRGRRQPAADADDDAASGSSSQPPPARGGPSFTRNSNRNNHQLAVRSGSAPPPPPPASNDAQLLEFLSKWVEMKKWLDPPGPGLSCRSARVKRGNIGYSIFYGKLAKRSHGRLTQSWHERHFVLSAETGDLYYWSGLPSPNDVLKDGTRVLVGRAKMTDPGADERTKDGAAGYVKLNNVSVARKAGQNGKAHDSLVLAFIDTAAKNEFVKTLLTGQEASRAAASAPREEDIADENEEEEEEEDDDAAGPTTPSPQQSLGEHEDSQALENGTYPAEDLRYERGGLGMGSNFFNADDVRTDGLMRGHANLIVPAEFRSSADAPLETSRVEGNDVLAWLSSDIAMYCTIIMDTMAAMLPKVAVMNVIERVIANELQYRLQREAVHWDFDEELLGSPKALRSQNNGLEVALKDVEEQMVTARMASSAALVEAARDGNDTSAAKCRIPVLALALAGCDRVLSAAQQPSPPSVLEQAYGTFPTHVFESAETAASRLHAAKARAMNPEYSSGRTATDPLNPELSVMHQYMQPAPPEDAVEENGRRGMFGNIGGALRGRRGRASVSREAEVESRSDSVPDRRPPRRTAPAADRGSIERTSAPGRASAPADPLGGGGGLGAAGFGGDPLAASRPSRPEASRRPAEDDEDDDEQDDEDSGDGPLQRSAQAQPRPGSSSGSAMRAAPPPPVRRSPAAAPPARRAPAAPPAPAVGRAVPARPAPVAPPPRRPAARPAPGPPMGRPGQPPRRDGANGDLAL